MKGHLLVLLSMAALSGCTAVSIQPLTSVHSIDSICIKENTKVQVSDFLTVLRDGLSRNNIRSEVFVGNTPEGCEYVMTYTALRTWDITPYLSHAEIRLEHDGLRIAYGEFRLRGKGGLDPKKWASTETKIAPVIDEMFGSIKQSNK